MPSGEEQIMNMLRLNLVKKITKKMFEQKMVELKGSKHFLLNGCVLKNLNHNKARRVKHHHSIKSNKNFSSLLFCKCGICLCTDCKVERSKFNESTTFTYIH